MGTPAFSLALLWDRSSSPIGIKQLMENLDSYFPCSKIFNIALTLSETNACLHFSIDVSLSTRGTLAQVELEVMQSGGRMVDLLRIPEDKREEFSAQFLIPAHGAALRLNRFKDCAGWIQEHLIKLARGGVRDKGLVATTASAAARRWLSQLPSRRQLPRFGCSLQVQLQAGNGFVYGLVTNISLGGLFVCTSQRALKSELFLKVQLPDGYLLQTTARLVHVEERHAPGGVGLAFSPADPAFTRELARSFSPVQQTR
jgi:hypothetical protein